MAFTLPELPFAFDALAPVMSRETLELHYGKHHKGYVDKLNRLVRDTDLENKSLEELMINIQVGDIFNNAAQAWNHAFFWQCLTPRGGGQPTGALRETIDRQFGSFENFRAQFANTAADLFGSGWVWLVRLANGALSIDQTANADNPITQGHTPLLALDVWEHAYYVDYRNDRAKFVEAFWDVASWEHAARLFDEAESRERPRSFERGRPREETGGVHAP